MGCDIHLWCEVETVKGTWVPAPAVFDADRFEQDWFKTSKIDKPFLWRNYNMFAFLAGVRNESGITPIVAPRGLPKEGISSVWVEEYEYDGHSASWLLISELLEFDYDRQADGIHPAGPLTYRQLLPPRYFEQLEQMDSLGDPKHARIVFFFDN